MTVTPIHPDDAKREALRSLLPNFLRRRAEDVERIRDAVAREDFDAVEKIGHNLRGNGASYGFPQLSAIGERIENSARDRDAKQILSANESLAEQLARIDDTTPTK